MGDLERGLHSKGGGNRQILLDPCSGKKKKQFWERQDLTGKGKNQGEKIGEKVITSSINRFGMEKKKGGTGTSLRRGP